jgi:excisionase family DNA binding protein
MTVRFLTVREAAAIARLSPYHLRYLLRERRLQGARPGGRGAWRIPAVELTRYLGEPPEEQVR